jgi:hypothetical protein
MLITMLIGKLFQIGYTPQVRRQAGSRNAGVRSVVIEA